MHSDKSLLTISPLPVIRFLMSIAHSLRLLKLVRTLYCKQTSKRRCSLGILCCLFTRYPRCLTELLHKRPALHWRLEHIGLSSLASKLFKKVVFCPKNPQDSSRLDSNLKRFRSNFASRHSRLFSNSLPKHLAWSNFSTFLWFLLYFTFHFTIVHPIYIVRSCAFQDLLFYLLLISISKAKSIALV